ncbi:hypothetical protein B5F11_16345 [Anaerotruncus colihominis]|uniref:Uncharacterized protein n=1 Tax=Anaerotruncus colihominis TaxID=169435 RepID=A0A1Y4MGI8_9FIRM|nr:hypothetical protein B5F11_16345 [Anaerotruncus colihominis]
MRRMGRPWTAARPVKANRPSYCSRRSRPKFFAELFLKKREAGACKIRVRPHGVCHGFCLGQAERPSRILAACGPRFYEGCGPGEGRCPRKKARPAWGLAFFLTRRLLKKAGENF